MKNMYGKNMDYARALLLSHTASDNAQYSPKQCSMMLNNNAFFSFVLA